MCCYYNHTTRAGKHKKYSRRWGSRKPHKIFSLANKSCFTISIHCGFIIIHLHLIYIPKHFLLFLTLLNIYFHASSKQHFLCLTNTEMPVLYFPLIEYDCVKIYRHMLRDTLPYLYPLCLELFHFVGYITCMQGNISFSVYIPLVQSSLFPNQSAFLSQMEQAHGCCQATVWPSTLQGSHGNHPLCQFIQWL